MSEWAGPLAWIVLLGSIACIAFKVAERWRRRRCPCAHCKYFEQLYQDSDGRPIKNTGECHINDSEAWNENGALWWPLTAADHSCRKWEVNKAICTKHNPNPDLPHDCHPDMEFSHTYEDWWDGDEDDIYYCPNCGKRIVIYVPR